MRDNRTLMAILFSILLVFANGFFVAAELALVKVRASQLEVRAAEGNGAARVARQIQQNLPRYLAVTQLGITLASLLLGWVGEPAFEHALKPVFDAMGIPEDISHYLAFGLGFSLITFMHIVVGEVAPKNLAIARPDAIAIAVAWPMRLLYTIFLPALVVLNGASNLVLRLIGVEPQTDHGLSMPAEELKQIAEESAESGHITKGEGTLLSNVFRFSDRVAREIMVPRAKVRGIDLKRPVEESLQFALESGHSRYPLYDGDLDGIVGVLNMKDLMPRLASAQPIKSLRDLARPPMWVPETMPAQRLLRIFQRQRSHLAVVLDEYGGVTGVITLEDTIEELVGEIQDEHDEERQPVETIEGGFSVEGRMLLSEIAPLLDIPEIESQATTLSGFVMEHLGRVASVGDAVPLGTSWVGRVVQVERRAIERVEITPGQPEIPEVADPPADP